FIQQSPVKLNTSLSSSLIELRLFIGISSRSAAHAIAKAYRYSTLPHPPWLNKIYQRLFQPTPKCISL
ncbi:hypothetical protein MOG60_022580, partial [Escherichia coli]|nr:hypothetical protein [Escherichia coli]